MNPYRARFERVQRDETIVDDVVVIDHWSVIPFGDTPYTTRMATVVYRDGRMSDLPVSALICTEPSYIAGGREDEPDHEHVMSPARPVLEGVRVIGTVRTCTVEGCGHSETTPTRPASS